MLAEWATKKALDLAFGKAKQYLAEAKTQLTSTPLDAQSALALHQQGVQRWCEEISFADLKQAKRTMNVYVGLDVYVYPRSLRIEPGEALGHRRLDSVLADSTEHLVVLGQPGAGKSTTMKYACHRLLHDENFLPDGPSFPVVIRLREIGVELGTNRTGGVMEGQNIFSALARHLGLVFRASGATTPELRTETTTMAQSVVLLFLDALKPLLVLDGFDELHTDFRAAAVEEIRTLTRQLAQARVIVTSRTGEFRYQIDNAAHFEICPLTKPQIVEFAKKWLADGTKAGHFVEEIERSPFSDTAIKPLTLAHLCAIYDRLGRIPEKPKTVYRKVVNLLIEEWDEQRSVRRQSRYADFSSDRKFDFLCRLAFELAADQRRGVFSVDDLKMIYREICGDFDLRVSESKQVLTEIEGHTGLFVQAGFEAYEFVHNSLQEYLAAEYIKGLPSIPSSHLLLAHLPNELAIAVAISTNPSSYLTELVLTRFQSMNLSGEFFATFIPRLLQEKPEFNAQPEVVLALLVLYALHLEGAQIAGQQLPLLVFDDMAAEFERLLESLTKRNHRSVMLDYYEEDGRRRSVEGSEIVLLRLTENRLGLKLPPRLYARPTFFETQSKIKEGTPPVVASTSSRRGGRGKQRSSDSTAQQSLRFS